MNAARLKRMAYRGHRFAMASADDDLLDETDYPDGNEDVDEGDDQEPEEDD